MTVNEMHDWLVKKFPGQDVKFIGSGSDSNAFRVADTIVRFSIRDKSMFVTEAAVCNHIRPEISVQIPKISVYDDGDVFFVSHPMVAGNKWSWHKFMWSPRRQKNLAVSCAKFLAQLHGVDTRKLIAVAPALGRAVPYIAWDDIAQTFAMFLTPRQMAYFRKNYERIISRDVAGDDMVLVHMGLKGANSVVDDNGELCGVFDFLNCGIYERWRDLVLFSISGNRALNKKFVREYARRTGRVVDRGRIADLAVVEFLWRKRWFIDGKFCPMGDRFVRKNVASALVRFHRMPRCMTWLVYARITLRARRNVRRK